VAEESLAENGDAAQIRQRQHRCRGKARIGAAELYEMQQRGQTLASHGDGNADDDLIEAPTDAEKHHNEGDRRAAQAAREKAEPEGAGEPGGDEPGVGAE
jgi:hypothetical protein